MASRIPWGLVALVGGGLVLLFGASAVGAPTPVTPPNPLPPVPPGGTGDAVWSSSNGKMHTKDAQAMLKALGPAASDSRMTNLVVDGSWGPMSRAAMKDFQAIKGMAQTGIVGPDDADTLYATWVAAGSP